MRRAARSVLVIGLVVFTGGTDGQACDDLLAKNLKFSELQPAKSDAEKREVRVSGSVELDHKQADLSYTTVLRSGESLPDDPGHTFGLLVDDHGDPILQEDGSQLIADSNDFSSLLPVGDKIFSVAHFESQPGGLYLTELAQDDTSGKLTATRTRPLDLKDIHGIWNPCAGMVTPWRSHLGSEEYEPDARKGAEGAATMAPYFGGGTTLKGDPSKVNPYYYGFPVEVHVHDSGDAQVVKHYSMGRFAHELSYVMPDRKTVYQSDDGTNVGFYLYVADAAEKLDAGTLYALKWKQADSDSTLVDADVSFLELGHASDDEIAAWIDGGIKFDDIFDSAKPDEAGGCPQDFHSVNANGVGVECLKLKSGQEQPAAFLESRRYAGYLGATTELRKEEGISFDPVLKRLYVSYSEVQYGMEDGKKNGKDDATYDSGTSNDVKVRFNTCGAVYAYELGADADKGSEYVAKRARGVLAGRMTTLADPDKLNPTTIDAYPDDSPFAGSTCDVDAIANPDNVSFVPGEGTLVIGEDSTDGHQNDAVWSYQIADGALTRIATTPYGAETTSVYYYPRLGAFSYLMAVVQHPYGESDKDKFSDAGEKHSYFGYVGLPVQLEHRD